MNSQQAQYALEFLADVANDHRNSISEYPEELMQPSDDEEDIKDNPILDSFMDATGNAGVVRATNMTYAEMYELYKLCEEKIREEWKGSKRNKSKYSLMDILFLMLVSFKSGTTWFFVANQFRLHAATVERIVVRLIKCISVHLYDHFIGKESEKSTMENFRRNNLTFSNTPEALYAVDVRLQHCYRPTGAMENVKKYFSGKHKMYGLKNEFSVAPSGLCIGITPHSPGSVHDITIFKSFLVVHEKKL